MVVWFLAIGGARRRRTSRDDPSVLRAVNPYYGGALPDRQRLRRLRGAGRGVPGRDRRRGALRRHGPFRPLADPRRLAVPGPALPGAELPGPGRRWCCSHPHGPRAIPFFDDGSRTVAYWPVLVLATAATVIASQAVITGAFSLTQQAMQLGLLPRMDITPHLRDPGRPDLRAADQHAC